MTDENFFQIALLISLMFLSACAPKEYEIRDIGTGAVYAPYAYGSGKQP